MIQVEKLSYSYTHKEPYAVRDISFQVKEGEIFGFLGPSGAGKSTTQGILTGLLPMQEGIAEVVGYDMRKPKRAMFNQIGVSFEQSNVYEKLTARENLDFYKGLFDTETLPSMELLKRIGLDHVADQKASTFSKGMKHRLTFARSMINKPKLWFLDEPTTGLDPAIAVQIKEMIREGNREGKTIFLTTHNMFLAEELCDRVAFIVDGHLRLIDSPRNLKLQYGEKFVEVEFRENNQLHKETLSLIDESEKSRLQEIVEKKAIERMHTKEATLEEIFIKVTGRELV